MARPKQDGLLYFSFDTDFFYADKRIKRLQSKFENDGVLLYIYLLAEIYRNGYYLRWDGDVADDIAADLHLKGGFMEQVLEYLRGRSLLTMSTLSTGVTVITSPGIQKRYQEAVKNRKRQFKVDSEIWLLSEEETASCIKVANNDSFSEKNKYKSEKNENKSGKNDAKEIKRNKSKIKESKVKEIKPCTGDARLDDALAGFVEYRRQIKKPMTDKAVELAIKKLRKMTDNVDEQIAIVEQSVMNGWQGLFPLKENGRESKGNMGNVVNEVDRWV